MPDSTSTLKTLAGFADMLARAAGVLVGLSALSYFVGYRIERNYLSQAGASWVIDLFSTSELVREGQVIIIAVGATLFFSIMNLFESDGSAKKLRRRDIALNVISMALLFAAFVSSKYYANPRLDYLLSILAGTLIAAAAGFTIGELVGRLDETKRIWSGYHFYLILFFYFSAASMAPYFIGTNSAKLDLDPSATTLSMVTIDGEDTGKWRLMRIIGDKYLLVTLVENSASREFRVVPISSSIVITSTRENEKK